MNDIIEQRTIHAIGTCKVVAKRVLDIDPDFSWLGERTMNDIKLRSGPAPEYVQRFGDICSCGNPVMERQGAVWFPYHYQYGPPERCGDCRRFAALGGCYYHRWARILRETDEARREAMKALGDAPQYAGARALVEAEYQADAHEARQKMAKARTHFKAYHYGCKVNGEIKDDALRVRIIRLMNRHIAGMARARAVVQSGPKGKALAPVGA